MNDNITQQQKEPDVQVNEHIIRAAIENLKLEQNLGLGIIGGSIGGLLGAIIWAAVTYFTEYQIGYLAMGVGFLVGFGMNKSGKGIDRIFGIAGGIIALVSVLVGNFLVSLGYLAKYLEISYLDALLYFDYSMTFELLWETFAFMDLLFYALAVYAGYRFSFRKITQAQLLAGGNY